MKDEKLEAVAKEVFLSIPPDVRTGVFIDVFTPCDWHHAAQCMVDYAGILDDPREPFNLVCDMPVICTTAVTEKTVVSDVRPLVGLPDDAYDDIVAGEMDYVVVRSATDGPVYVEGIRPDDVEQAYDEYLDEMIDIMAGSGRDVLQDALEAAQWLAYRLSELTQRHLVLERSRTWKLAERESGSPPPRMRTGTGGRYSNATDGTWCVYANVSPCRTACSRTRWPTGLADLLRSATRTERDECFDMLEQVETGRPL